MPDIPIDSNAGRNPEGFATLDEAEWTRTIAADIVAPIMLVKAVLLGMIERKFGRIVNITSAMVIAPRPRMTMSSGVRAGLTAAMKGPSQEVAQHNVTINDLRPERFDVAPQHQMAEDMMKRFGISYADARRRQVEGIAARRLSASRANSERPVPSCAEPWRASCRDKMSTLRAEHGLRPAGFRDRLSGSDAVSVAHRAPVLGLYGDADRIISLASIERVRHSWKFEGSPRRRTASMRRTEATSGSTTRQRETN